MCNFRERCPKWFLLIFIYVFVRKQSMLCCREVSEEAVAMEERMRREREIQW